MSFVDAQGLRPFAMSSSRKGSAMSQSMRAGHPAKIDGSALDLPALAQFLRRRHPHCAADYVARAAGIPAATVKDWLQLRCRPSTRHFLTLVGRYGAPLIAACWPDAPDFVLAACQAARLARLDDDIAALHAERAALGLRAARS